MQSVYIRKFQKPITVLLRLLIKKKYVYFEYSEYKILKVSHMISIYIDDKFNDTRSQEKKSTQTDGD